MYATFITSGCARCNALLTRCEVKTGQVLFCVFIIMGKKRSFSRGISWRNLGQARWVAECRILFILPAHGFSHI